MIPIRMIENWLLGDENVYKKIFGSLPASPKLPNKPEYIWGSKYKPDSNYPKHYLRRVLEQYHKDRDTNNYIIISKNIDIENLKKACNYSFGKFYNDIETLQSS